MKILERIALILFSIIILILSVFSCLVIGKILDLKIIYNYLNDAIYEENFIKITLVVIAVLALLAIKALFFPSKVQKRTEIKSGVLLENKDGRLLISRDTIENMVISIAKSFEDAVDVQTKIILDENNIITVFLAMLVKENTVIKDLSSQIQTKIKETIKINTDLEVSQVNINIQNINSLNEGEKSNKITEKKQEKVIVAEIHNNEEISNEKIEEQDNSN